MGSTFPQVMSRLRGETPYDLGYARAWVWYRQDPVTLQDIRDFRRRYRFNVNPFHAARMKGEDIAQYVFMRKSNWWRRGFVKGYVDAFRHKGNLNRVSYAPAA